MKTLFVLMSTVVVLVLLFFVVGFSTEIEASHNFTLMGKNFNETLPLKYTCEGEALSPALFWAGAPKETQSYAITMHQNLGNGHEKVCMVQYHIDGKLHELKAGDLSTGTWGVNSLDDGATYAAPCSNGKSNQKYILTIYALSKAPSIRPSNTTVTKAELELEISKITLAKAIKTVVLEKGPKGMVLAMCEVVMN